MMELEETSYKIEFKCSELPDDMKMLCFLTGELSNAAFYFSTFGNVNQKDCNDVTKEYGLAETKSWHSFTYAKRIAEVKKVKAKAKEIENTSLAPSTKRTQLTTFIKQLKSRQEEIPLVGNYIDRAKCEPLHLKNNTTKELFMKVFVVAISE